MRSSGPALRAPVHGRRHASGPFRLLVERAAQPPGADAAEPSAVRPGRPSRAGASSTPGASRLSPADARRPPGATQQRPRHVRTCPVSGGTRWSRCRRREGGSPGPPGNRDAVRGHPEGPGPRRQPDPYPVQAQLKARYPGGRGRRSRPAPRGRSRRTAGPRRLWREQRQARRGTGQARRNPFGSTVPPASYSTTAIRATQPESPWSSRSPPNAASAEIRAEGILEVYAGAQNSGSQTCGPASGGTRRAAP